MHPQYDLRISDEVSPLARELKGALTILALAVEGDPGLLLNHQDFPALLNGLMRQAERLVVALDSLDEREDDTTPEQEGASSPEVRA